MRTIGWWYGLLLLGALAFAAPACDSGGDGGGPGDDTVEAGDDTDACVPECGDNTCGPDGCDGQCGVCTEDSECVEGQCVVVDPCDAICAAAECGWVDVCNCGDCSGGLVCLGGTCQTPMQCGQKGFESVRAEGRMAPTDGGGFSLYFQSLAGSAAPFDLIVLELDSASGVVEVPLSVDAALASMKQAGARVYMLTGWQGGAVKGWTGGGYDKLLVPSRGSIEISALSSDEGTRFTATLVAVQFNEATADFNTGAITMVPSGQTWCLDGMALDAEPVHQNPACVPAGTGTMIGDTITDFSLVNCYGQWINLHDRCQKSEALWLVATAGW